LVGRNVRVP